MDWLISLELLLPFRRIRFERTKRTARGDIARWLFRETVLRRWEIYSDVPDAREFISFTRYAARLYFIVETTC